MIGDQSAVHGKREPIISSRSYQRYFSNSLAARSLACSVGVGSLGRTLKGGRPSGTNSQDLHQASIRGQTQRIHFIIE